MKTERNILIAFLLNLSFCVFELIGGMVTGSVAIVSDALHDAGDAASIGVSWFLEKKSKGQPDETYTYGYGRYSVLGGLFTTLILLVGSVAVIFNAVNRIIAPTPINYNGVIIFAVAGVCVNLLAARFTHSGESLNQKAVNLHMLEDVLGWCVVLVGAIVMRITNWALLDPIMSICVSVVILISALRNLREIMNPLLEKVPGHIDVAEVRRRLLGLAGIIDVHHIHLWSLDGQNNYATMHIVTDSEPHRIKEEIRELMHERGVGHVTVEIETGSEHCHAKHCHMEHGAHSHHGHHHSH